MANLAGLHRQPRDTGQFCGAAILPDGSQGATLASLGTRRSSGTSGALRLAGAKVQVLSSLGQPASTVGILQGASAGRAAWGCVVPASLGGSYAGTPGWSRFVFGDFDSIFYRRN